MTEQAFTLKVNGERLSCRARPYERLSDVLRNRLGLTGTKVGCNAGDCGACSVLIDGDVGCACLIAVAQIGDAAITTVEGLATDGAMSALQRSFLHHGAAQCGICTPGMLISAKALLDKHRQPARQQVEDALGGVLCRCTGYRKIVDAVVDAGRFNAAQPEDCPAAGQSVGVALRHLDGAPKVTGALRYGADTVPDDALFARVIRSPHHHARFTIGDKQAFLASHPGIALFVDAGDIPGRNSFGVIPAFSDQPVFAEQVARFRGEAVAALVGSREAVDAVAESDLPIEWTPLDHALTADAARGPSAPRLHETRDGNVLTRGLVVRGDSGAALQRAAHKVSLSIATPYIEHAYIEPEAGYAMRVGDRLELHGCTQAAYMNRQGVAEILGVDEQAVRVVPSACGGGFGSKLDLTYQPIVALAAWLTARPVALHFSRSESMRASTKRHPAQIAVTIGCDGDGTICGMEFDGVFNTGAYASWGPTVANRVPVHASGPYSIADYTAKSLAVHSNGPVAGAFRGFGVPQSAIAQETAFDRLADMAGMDRLDFRLKNALRNGLPTVTGQVFQQGVGIVDCLQALRPVWTKARARAAQFNRDNAASPLRKGVGVGTCWYGCGNTSLPNPSTVRIGVTARGDIVLHQGAIDIGQGANTVIAQIAADALGVPVHRMTLVGADTDLTPDCGKTSASRQTFVTGKAAQRAGEALRAQILRLGNVGVDATITLKPGVIELRDAGTIRAVPLDTLDADDHGYVLMAEETYDPPVKPLDAQGQGVPYAQYGYGAQLVELTVDTALGTVRLERIHAAHDVGRAVNPLLIEGQIEGGIAQGIGLALMEDYIPGRTENLHDYLIPTCGDVPVIESHILEIADAEGPYGAKGLGEHVLIPTAPAILNAIRDATGAVVADLPVTPDKLHAALHAAKDGGMS